MSPLWPSVAQLHVVRKAYRQKHQKDGRNEGCPDQPSLVDELYSQSHKKVLLGYRVIRVLFQFFLDLEVLHVQEAKDEAQEIGRASNPRFDVDVSEVLTPFHEVNKMSHVLYVSDDYLVDVERNSHANHCYHGEVPSKFVFGVNEDEEKGKHKYLHVVLKIPSPGHTHSLSVAYQVINKQKGFPGAIAVGHLAQSHVLFPKRSVSGMDVDCVIEQNGHSVAGPKSEYSVDYSHGVFQYTFRLLSHERVSDKKSSNEEENVDSEKGPGDKAKEELLNNGRNTSNIGIVFKSDREKVAKDDPKHTNGFDPIEDIEVVLLVDKYLERLSVVEGLQYFISRCVLFFFFRSHTSEEGQQTYNCQQNDGYDREVEPSRFIVNVVLRINVNCANSQFQPCQCEYRFLHFLILKLFVHYLFDILVCANLREAEAHVHSCTCFCFVIEEVCHEVRGVVGQLDAVVI